MNVRQSVLGQIAVLSVRHLETVDVGSLVRRLLLFDRVIVKSFRLREIPTLVRTFQKTGFTELINSGLLQFTCEFTCIITDINRGGIRQVPINHFTFGTADSANREHELKKELVALQAISGLKNSDRAALEETVWRSIVRPPGTYAKDLLAQLDHDIRTNAPVLRQALIERIRIDPGCREANIPDADLRVEEVKERIFHLRSSLGSSGLAPEKEHSLLHQAVTAVANLDQRLAEMQVYSAITGFQSEEAPMLFGRLAGIVSGLNPRVAEEQFERVIEIADVPDFKPGQRVDVERLLKARGSSECREFREWLASLDKTTDSQIKEMVGSIKRKVASVAGSTGGRIMRFAATTGIGLIPIVGPIAGAAVGALDSFLVDRVLPRSGPVAFLSDTYPSLFVSP